MAQINGLIQLLDSKEDNIAQPQIIYTTEENTAVLR